MSINGGLVKTVIPFPGAGNRIAARGVWSGGTWTPGEEMVVHQYREQEQLGLWRVVGVDHLFGPTTDLVLILLPVESFQYPLRQDDVLIFGEGSYTSLPVCESHLPLLADASIEVAPERYNGVALLEGSTVKRIIFFHPADAIVPRGHFLPVSWRGRHFRTRVAWQEVDDWPFEQVQERPTRLKLLQPVA